jgi:AcrR family transcriptional regulator
VPERHLDKRERIEQVLDAACIIIEQDGVAALNMSRLATAAGITRPWLYQLFPDVESVLLEIYLRIGGEHIHDRATPPPRNIPIRAHLKAMVELWIDIPPAPAMVILYAFSNLTAGSTQRNELSRRLYEVLEEIWITPARRSGLEPDAFLGAVGVIYMGIVGLVQLMHKGVLSRDGFRQAMDATIDALVPADWKLTDEATMSAPENSQDRAS